MDFYPCADPKKCGVTKHRTSNIAPACGATQTGKPRVADAGLLTPPLTPVRRRSFPVSRAVDPDGTVTWEFPVEARGGDRRIATVARGRGSLFLDVTISGPGQELIAQVIPTKSRPGVSDGFIIAVPTGDGEHASVANVSAVVPPSSAQTLSERARLIEDDSNWSIKGEVALRHYGGSRHSDDEIHNALAADAASVAAAAKAVRLHTMVAMMRESLRSRAEMGAMARADASAMAAYERIGKEVEAVFANSRLSLQDMSV